MNLLLTNIHTDMKKFIYKMLCMAILSLLASCVDQQFESIAIKEVKATICDFDYEQENEDEDEFEPLLSFGMVFIGLINKELDRLLQ